MFNFVIFILLLMDFVANKYNKIESVSKCQEESENHSEG